MGYTWDKVSINRDQDINIIIRLKRTTDGYSLCFPATRSALKSGEQVLFHLAAFSSRLNLKQEESRGSWLISAHMTTASGHSLETTPRNIIIDPKAPSREFYFFSFEHLSALFLLTANSVIIVLMSIKKPVSSP